MKMIVLSHPYEVKAPNLSKAQRWAAWLTDHLGAIVVVPWEPLCRFWPETAATRSKGIDCTAEVIRRADAVLMIGDHESDGMTFERTIAENEGRIVWDFVGCVDVPTFEGHALADALRGWCRE